MHGRTWRADQEIPARVGELYQVPLHVRAGNHRSDMRVEPEHRRCEQLQQDAPPDQRACQGKQDQRNALL